jgi:translocation and assembly module TamA
VHSLTIEGTHQLSAGTIKGKILTAASSRIPFTSPKYFDPLVWETDLRRIERLYQARGFYQAHVQSADVIPRKDGGVDLRIRVNEQQPTPITALQISGLDDLGDPERKRVLAKLPLTLGEPFVEDQWQQEKSELVSRLRSQGHAEAHVEGEALVDVARSEARLTLATSPGEVYRFGEVHVRSLSDSHIDPALIWEQARLATAGAVFSDDAVEEAQRRVFAMGVFSTARVAPGKPDPAAGEVPLQVTVREAPFHTLRLGGGIAIDQVRQEARLLTEWSNRNFLGGLRRLTLQLTAGWAFIPNTYAVVRNQLDEGARHGPIYRARADFEQPRFLGRPSLRWKDLLESERSLEETYDSIGARTQNGVGWQPLSTLTIFPSHQLQIYHLNGPATATAQTSPLALGCRSDPCSIVLSFLEELATWDKRDSPLEPRRGHYLSLAVQQGGGPLGGDYTYVRFVPEGRFYRSFPLGERQLTLATRLQLGTLLPTSGNPDDTAVTTRFYAGGGQSMRGYGLRRLSPLLLAPGPGGNEDTPLLTLPIGGNGLVDGSFEARYAVTSNLLVAAFADFGTVTHGPFDANLFPTMQLALGVGLRYLTPVGPVRVDIGVRLPVGRPPPLYRQDGVEITYLRLGPNFTQPGRETGANINRTCFGIGPGNPDTWVRDGLCAFHISIGEAY